MSPAVAMASWQRLLSWVKRAMTQLLLTGGAQGWCHLARQTQIRRRRGYASKQGKNAS
jgi:hypothetical protein